MDYSRYHFFETKRRLEDALARDAERRWREMCDKLIGQVTRAIWQE